MPLPIVVGTVTASACVAAVDKAVGLADGVVIANAIPLADVTVMFWVVVTVATPAEFSHSAVSTTVPAAVGVIVSNGVTPVASVVSVVAESVAAPVLVAPVEKRMVRLALPIPAASVTVAVAASVPAPTWIVLLGVRAKASVEPLISIGILADCPPTVAVTVAVRLLKSARPLFSTTIAWPFESVVAELADRLPLVVAKETATPGMTALDKSTSVAVRVAEVELSVRIEFVDVPNAIPAGTVAGVVVVPELGALSLQPISATIAAASRNGTENPVMVLLNVWSRT